MHGVPFSLHKIQPLWRVTMVSAPSLQVSYVLVGDIVHLRLNQLPSDTFAVAIAVVRGNPFRGWECWCPWGALEWLSDLLL